jgi:hypothetical protein
LAHFEHQAAHPHAAADMPVDGVKNASRHFGSMVQRFAASSHNAVATGRGPLGVMLSIILGINRGTAPCEFPVNSPRQASERLSIPGLD